MIKFFTAPVAEGAQQAVETAAQAPVAAEAAPQAEEVVAVAAQNGVMGGNWSFWVMIIAMIAIMYFFMWRPEKKRRQEMQNFRDGLKAGDKVITAGGIYAVVKKVEEASLLIEVDSNVTLRIDKNMVVAAPAAPEK
jgi:preprotein translocase subunit YajC